MRFHRLKLNVFADAIGTGGEALRKTADLRLDDPRDVVVAVLRYFNEDGV